MQPQSCDCSQCRHGCDPPDREVVLSRQGHRAFHNPHSLRRVTRSAGFILINAVSMCVLLNGFAGCGFSASDPAAKQSSPAAATRDATVAEQGVGQLSDSSVTASKDRSGEHDRSAAGQSTEKTDEDDLSPIANIPEVIAKDLASPDARDRYRALDYWDTPQRVDAPIDLVFEAMEDEDPAVRAKATAIVDHYWEEEQERENNGGGGESEEGS